jgi:hypothetical protein
MLGFFIAYDLQLLWLFSLLFIRLQGKLNEQNSRFTIHTTRAIQRLNRGESSLKHAGNVGTNPSVTPSHD